MIEKMLGLDLGRKTLGIAFNDSLGLSHPLETFRFEEKAYRRAKERVIEIIDELQIYEIALGLPLHLSGGESEMSKEVRIFKDRLLEDRPHLNIVLIDERLTSVAAHRTLKDLGMKSKKQKQVVDMIAAQEILETHIRIKKQNERK
ncbi:MAG: Holliday junction resolvase RuvX [Bacilli bacterium]|jgi:putative Holliday junction resolvase|nr:Holliday junction resolvase RuvX [Bacilli bacterium]